ncbi:MAG: hypothetical protein R3B99_03660 [Polyangiales bacterium]
MPRTGVEQHAVGHVGDDADLEQRLEQLDQLLLREEVLEAANRVEALELGLQRLEGEQATDLQEADRGAGDEGGQEDRSTA